MSGVRVHRNQARRYATMAQGAAAVLLVAAFAAYAFLPVADQAKALPASDGSVIDDRGDLGPPIDFAVASELLRPWDKASALPADADPDVGDDQNPPDGPSSPEWKYLGAIVEPHRLVAIVDADGAQRLMAPGATYAGADGREVRIVEVTQDQIIVAEGDGGRRTIERMPKQGAVVGSAETISMDAGEGIDHEGADGMEGIDPRVLERNGERRSPPGSRRTTPPGSRNVPRSPRPTPGATPPRPSTEPGA